MGCIGGLYILSHYIMVIAIIVGLITKGSLHEICLIIANLCAFIIVFMKYGYARNVLTAKKHGVKLSSWPFILLGPTIIHQLFAVLAIVTLVYTTSSWWIFLLAIIMIYLWYHVLPKD